MDRRLAAILAADVVGYSRLMGVDESGTLARLMAHRNEFIDPTITAHRGRIVKLMGDGALVEFASVVDALGCAVAIQRGMAERNHEQPVQQRIEFRIGINLGDVIVEGDDIYGDGVNVAARLEGLAEAGGICIADSVRTAVGSKLPLEYEFLGEQQVKNITEPVRAYRAQLETGAELPALAEAQPKQASRSRLAIGAVVAAGLIGSGLLAWYQPWAPDFEPASVERMAYPLPDNPSIAVLPFDNVSNEQKLDFFARGLTENITSALSKAPGLFVIASNSAVTYTGKPVNVKRVAEELGVQYVLEGNIHKHGEQLRITSKLVDAVNGRYLWADRFDRPAGDVFAVQDEITKRIFTELQVKLTEGEHARMAAGGTDQLEAWLLRIEAYGEYIKFTRESQIRARELYQAASKADPNWAFPLAGIAFTHWYEARRRWSASWDESIRLGVEASQRAIELQPDEAIGYMALANLMFLNNQTERGIELRRKAIELAPNSFAAVGGFAIRLSEVNQEHEAVELFERAIRLSPKHPWWIEFGYGLALHLVARKEEAVETYKKGISTGTKNVPLRVRLAAVYADLGQLEEAKAVIGEVLRMNPKYTVTSYQESYPFPTAERNIWYKDLLVRAGLPEQVVAPIPEKPSIAVLPFNNMSGDTEQEYFVDGMTDDLITDLSRISGLFVIARNSTFAYKGTSPDVRQVSRDLGVKYVLEGSMRRAGDKVRINAQLIDASTGGHVWAERFDRKLTDVFALQDEVSRKIVSALAVKLTTEEEQRFSQAAQANPEAYDLLLRGLEQFRRFTRETNAAARDLFKRAITHDPDFARAYANVATTFGIDVLLGWTEPSEDLFAEAFEYADKALKLDPKLRQVYFALSNLYLPSKQHDKAIDAARTAVTLHPNYADGHALLAQALVYAGRPQDSLDALGKAMALNPRYAFFYTWIEGHAHMLMRKHGEAISAFEKVIEKNAHFPGAHLTLASLYGNVGRIEDAKWEAVEVLSLRPDFSLAEEKKRVPYKNPADLEYYIAGLRKAGLPE